MSFYEESSRSASISGAFFIGRERERAEIGRALESARGGSGGLILVTGEPGIGKTRLAEKAVEDGRRLGFNSSWGSCWEDPGAPPYWPWVEILRDCLGDLDRGRFHDLGPGGSYLADLLSSGGGDPLSLPRGGHITPESARFHLFDALVRALIERSQERPLVIVFDDAHTADVPSLRLLGFLARALRSAALVLIVTSRGFESAGGDRPALLAPLVRAGTHLPLGEWSETEVGRFVSEAFGTRAAPDLIRAIRGTTRGNPFFVNEVARLLRAEGRLEEAVGAATPLPIPGSVLSAVRDRLEPLGATCRDVLAVASVQGRELDVALVATVSGLSRRRVLEELARARGAGIVAGLEETPGRYWFRHELIRNALYANISELERVSLHARTGEALESRHRDGRGPRLAEIARHYEQAALGGRADRAVEYLVRAGRRAEEVLAHEEAAALYERAIRVGTLFGDVNPQRRCDLLLAVGEARAHAGDRQAAREACLDAAAAARSLGRPETIARAALACGGPWVEIGRADPTLVALLEEALGGLGAGETRLRMRVMALLARELHWSSDPRRVEGLAADALSLGRQAGDQAALAEAMTARIYSLWSPDRTVERLVAGEEIVALAGQVGDEELALRGRLWRVNDLLELGEVEAAELEMDAYARGAAALRQPSYLYYVPRGQAMRALLAGRLEEAERLFADAFALAAEAHPRLAGEARVTFETFLLWERGEIDRVPTDLVVRHQEENPGVDAWECGLAWLHAEQRRFGEARRQISRIAKRGLSKLRRDGNWLVALSLLSRACVAAGDRRRAAELYDLLEPFRGRNALVPRSLVCFGCVSHHLGALAASIGRLDAAAAHLDEGLAMYEKLGARPWVARARLEKAGVLMARGGPGERKRALRMLTSAADEAGELGLAHLSRHVDSLVKEHAASRPARAADRPAASATTAVLRHDGDFWTVGAANRVVRLKGTKGFRYLAVLLRHPERDFHVSELVALVEGAPRGGQKVAEAEGLSVRRIDERGDRRPDARARRSYRERMDELRSELDEATRFNDLGRIERTRAELATLAAEIGPPGMARARSHTAAERARVNLTKQLHLAIRRIEAHVPELGRDLRRTIRTGWFCAYVPDRSRPVEWEV